MFTPEEQQIEICLLKSNLEEIEHDLIAQRSAIPTLDAENEQKYRETMDALRVARSYNVEIERLKLEDVKLTAKRMQLKRQYEELTKSLENARRLRSELEISLQKDEQETELEIRKYEGTLRDLAERFRKTRAFYDEDEMKIEMEIVKEIILELQNEEQSRQIDVTELKSKLNDLVNNVPGNILCIIGQEELDKTLQSLSSRCEALRLQRHYLLRNKAITNSMFSCKY